MRKNSILISGAILLGSVAAVGTIGFLSNSFKANAYEVGGVEAEVIYSYVNAQSTVPAADAQLPDYDGISKVEFAFPGGGDYGYMMNREVEGNILIKQGENILFEISSNDQNSVYVDSKYTSTMVVKFPETITAPGEYSVVLPQGICKQVKEEIGGSETAPTVTFTANAEQTLSFSIVKAIKYEFGPKPGDYMRGSLTSFTYTYPVGTKLTLKSSTPKPVFGQFNRAGVNFGDAENPDIKNDFPLSELTVSVNENVVTLTLDDPDALKVFTKTANLFDYLKVPAGLWTAEYDGITETNAAYYYENYGIVAFNAADIRISPELNSAEPIPATDLATIAFRFPTPATWAKADNAIMGTLKITVGTTTKTIANLYPAGSNEAGTILYAKQGETYSSSNVDLSTVPTCKVYMEINPGSFSTKADAASNQKMTLSNFNVKGIDELLITNSSPANNGVVSSSTSSISLTLFSYAKIANEDAKIRLYKDDVLLQEWKAGETTTTALKNATGNGSTSAAFKLATSLTKTSYGTYKITVEPGAFAWTADPEIKTAGYESMFYILEPIASTFEPTPYYTDKNINYSPLDKLTIVYPEDCVLSGIEGKKITELKYSGAISLANGAKDPSTYSPYASYTVPVTSYEFEGNKVIFHLTKQAAVNPNNYVQCFDVPDATFMITRNGNTVPNTRVWASYLVGIPDVGTFSGAVDNVLAVENFSDIATISYVATQAIGKGTGEAYLYDSNNEQVASYTGAIDDETAGVANRKIDYTSTDLPEDAAPQTRAIATGDYTFVIPAGSFKYGTTAGNSQFDQTQPYTLNVTVANVNTLVEEIFTDAEIFNIYTINGAVIALDVNKDYLQTLEPGLYVINGKVVLLKK